LLGHAVSENEAVSIKSLGLSTVIPSRLSPEARVEALKALNQRLASSSGPDDDAEEEAAAVDEALRSTRPNYRPVG
jgi:hypothetical protein